jgi:hypothetical protein
MKKADHFRRAPRVRALTLKQPPTRLLILLFIIIVILAIIAIEARGETQRRMNIGLNFNYYLLDDDYFAMDSAVGALFAFRYEIANNIYFENCLGSFASNADGINIDGMNYQFGAAAILPYLIPYRPVVRLGVGFLSVNPVTVTPTESFRPGQTAFYFIAGAGMTRSIRENIIVEATANIYYTPYDYRIYEFDRSEVTTNAVRFTHYVFNLGISYSF